MRGWGRHSYQTSIDARLGVFWMRFVVLSLLEGWMSANIRFPDYMRLAPGTVFVQANIHCILYSQKDNRTPSALPSSSETIYDTAYTLALLSS
jgi:hypothetical protein